MPYRGPPVGWEALSRLFIPPRCRVGQGALPAVRPKLFRSTSPWPPCLIRTESRQRVQRCSGAGVVDQARSDLRGQKMFPGVRDRGRDGSVRGMDGGDELRPDRHNRSKQSPIVSSCRRRQGAGAQLSQKAGDRASASVTRCAALKGPRPGSVLNRRRVSLPSDSPRAIGSDAINVRHLHPG
jgi:hypothetical protein